MTVKLCAPIAVCMSRDFGFTDTEIGKLFNCSSSTIKNRLISIGYKKPSKQELAAQRLQAAWNDYGYSEKFELIGDYKGRYKPVQYRCKICGSISEKQASTISVTHSNIDCTSCWIRRDTETIAPRDYSLQKHLADDYAKGLSIAKIADKYNMQQRPVSALIANAGIEIDCNRDCYKDEQRKTYESIRVAKENVKRINSGFSAIQADLKTWRKTIDFTEDANSVFDKERKWFYGWLKTEKQNNYKRTLTEYEPQIATCKHCGKQWIFWPNHRKKWARIKNAPVYCSKSCKNKHMKQIARKRHGVDNIRHRLKRYGTNNRPRDHITLDAVIKRDNGICYICGCKTSKADSWRDASGHFICGSTYPTRDHVIPIAKGGTHTWDNVRLACMKCNSAKGATIPGPVRK